MCCVAQSKNKEDKETDLARTGRWRPTRGAKPLVRCFGVYVSHPEHFSWDVLDQLHVLSCVGDPA